MFCERLYFLYAFHLSKYLFYTAIIFINYIRSYTKLTVTLSQNNILQYYINAALDISSKKIRSSNKWILLKKQQNTFFSYTFYT